MWRWLPSELCNNSFFYMSARRVFFLQLIGIVFGVHLLILCLTVFIGWLQNDHQKFHVSLKQNNATYVLMPLQKKVLQKQNISQSTSGVHRKSQLMDHETYLAKKKAKQQQKAPQAKLSKSTMSSTKATQQSSKIIAQNGSGLKKEKVSVVIKSESNKSKNLKKLKQTIMAAEIVDLEIVPAPVAAPEQNEQKEVVTEQISVPEVAANKEQPMEKIEKVEVELDADLDDFDENNVVFVGYQELDQSLIASKIAHTVQQSWKAPVGMTHDVSCDVSVKIGADGTALSAKVVKSSGIFVYDLSARKTLLKIEYPKEIWNKTITIALGSS